MDAYWVIKKLSKEQKIKMKDIALTMGITPQSLNKSLRGRISLDTFKRAVEACGYEIYIVKGKDSRRLEDF